MSKNTAIFQSFVTASIENARGSQSSAQASAAAIMAAADPAAAMRELFELHRGEYLIAKSNGDKDAMRIVSTAWNSAKTGMDYWFNKRDLRASWPNYRSGEGEFTLSHVEDLNAKRKADREQRAEREAAETAAAKAKSAAIAADLWKSASLSDQLSHVMGMINQSGRPAELSAAILSELTIRQEAAARKAATAEARKAAAKTRKTAETAV